MSVQPVKELDGHRVLIVGASSGIGRTLGLLAAEAGARVAFAARRSNLVESAARDAGNGALAVVCDARDPGSCADSVARTVEAFGGLDSFVYSTAVDPLVRLADADADAWRNTFETNVIGAAMVCRAALPHLQASGGRAVFISATSVGRPLPGMGMYISSKAAMEEMIRAWRAEHPDVCFSNVQWAPPSGPRSPNPGIRSSSRSSRPTGRRAATWTRTGRASR